MEPPPFGGGNRYPSTRKYVHQVLVTLQWSHPLSAVEIRSPR